MVELILHPEQAGGCSCAGFQDPEPNPLRQQS
jgi:hypothetical protein